MRNLSHQSHPQTLGKPWETPLTGLEDGQVWNLVNYWCLLELRLFLPVDGPFLVIFHLWFFFLLYETLSRQDKHEANFTLKNQSGHSLCTCHPCERTLATISPKLARQTPSQHCVAGCCVACQGPAFSATIILPSDHLELVGLLVDNNTTPNWSTGTKNSIILLVALSKLSQAEYTWSLARIQNVLQIFSSKWLRSWMTNQAKLLLAKEIRQLQTYLQLRWPLKQKFWKTGEEKDRLRSFCCCLQHPASLLLAGGTWRPGEERNRKQEQCSFLIAASLLLERASLQRSGVPKAISSF